MNHFFLKEGRWKGNGFVSFSHSPETLIFTMRWDVKEGNDGIFLAQQEVAIEGLPPRINFYRISPLPGEIFHLFFSNDTLQDCTGEGFWNERKIEWQFHHPGLLDGFERYDRTGEKEYVFSAEYGRGEGFLTKISGSMRVE